MTKKKSSILYVFALLVTVTAVAVFALADKYTSFSPVSLNEIHWDQPPGLIAIKGIEREGHDDGTLFIRLKDGKEQFVYEGWDVKFSDYGSAFAFQKEFIPSTDTPHVLYYLQDGEFVTKLTIENSGGYIKDAEENPGRTYVFVELVKNNTSTFCILERVPSSGTVVGDQQCLELGISDVDSGLWNPGHERELVVKTKSNRIFTLDPWEKRPRQIYATGDSKKSYDAFIELFTKKTTDPSFYYGAQPKRFIQLPIATLVQDTTWSILPPMTDAKLAWVDDGHIVAKRSDSLEIIEYKTGRVAGLLYQSHMKDKPTLIHTQGNDIEL